MTIEMGTIEGECDKGEVNGKADAVSVILRIEA
jgi:hypothetical protein